MKKLIIMLIWTGIIPSLFSQHNLSRTNFSEGETVTNQFGDFAYQYNRIIALDPENPNQLIVTFVFINGQSHNAITYRQEDLNGHIEWIDHENGELKKEGIVEAVTASVPPNHVMSWKLTYKPGTKNKNNTVDVDKAALMVMNDNFQVVKKVFEKNNFLVK